MIFKFEVYFRVIAEKQDGQVSAQQVEEEDESSETGSLRGEGERKRDLFNNLQLHTSVVLSHHLNSVTYINMRFCHCTTLLK